MLLSPETVKYVADLSRIELTTEELDKLSKQLQAILGFINKLSHADISGITATSQRAVVWPPVAKATSQILPISNVLREDNPRESLSVEKTLANAPQKKGHFFVVPKVIE